jgi:hypothetical protein
MIDFMIDFIYYKGKNTIANKKLDNIGRGLYATVKGKRNRVN